MNSQKSSYKNAKSQLEAPSSRQAKIGYPNSRKIRGRDLKNSPPQLEAPNSSKTEKLRKLNELDDSNSEERRGK